MAQEFCKSAKRMCDPTDCNWEFCGWRDNEWIIRRMKDMPYSSESSRRTKETPTTSKNTSERKRD